MQGVVIDRNDIGMRATAGSLCLALKSRQVLRPFLAFQKIGTHQLDRHRPVDGRIVRLVDHAHRTAAEHGLNPVAVDL